MFNEDDKPRNLAKPYALGQDVEGFSLADLDETLAKLEAEIARLKAVKERKRGSALAADALFRKS